jgi:hypothetical protein
MAAKIKVRNRVTHGKFGNGVVKHVHRDGELFAIEFDERRNMLHACDGHCKSGKGWWCNDIEITLIKPKAVRSPQIDFMDTDILNVPVRVHYTFEKGYEGKSDSIYITTVTHLGVDVTAFALALHQDQFEAEISKYENADYCPEHDD